jgi:hypothetical protein
MVQRLHVGDPSLILGGVYDTIMTIMSLISHTSCKYIAALKAAECGNDYEPWMIEM